MKKTLHLKRVLRTALLVLLLSVVGKGMAQYVTIDNLEYYLGDSYAEVVGHKNGTSATGTLDIPSSVTYTYEWGEIVTLPVTGIRADAFSGCSGLTGSLVIPNSVGYIGEGAFENCIGFQGTLTLSTSLTYIGDIAFRGCSGLTGSLVIPDSVESIGEGAFENCSGFKGTLTLSPSMTYIGNWAFRGCSGFKGDLNIPDSVSEIGYVAFSDCSGFNGSLTLSNSLTQIKSYSFSGCSGFKGDLIIPNSVEYIESCAFRNCSGFSGSLIIGNSVTTIGNSDIGGTFEGCSGFKSVTIPQSLTSIYGNHIFYNCTGLTAVYYTGTIAQWCKIDFGPRVPFVLYANPLRYAHNLYINNHLVTDLVIPEGVTEIKQWAFCQATCLTSLKLPNSLKKIGLDAFCGCSNLSGKLIIPNSVTIIDDNAFSRCDGLTGNLVIPNSVIEVRGNAFCGCRGFSGDLILPNSVTFIGSGAFTDCSGFDGILSLPNSLISIGHYAFEGCCNLKGNLVIPSSATDIGCNAFKECNSFSKVCFMPSNCTNHLEDYHPYYEWFDAPPFEGCSGALVVGDNMHNIPAYLFKNAAFDEITLHNEVNSIGDEAFAGCDSLKTIRSWRNFPPALGDDVFANINADNVVVYVPCDQELEYRLADGWKDFSHYEMFIATWPLIVASNEPEFCETEVVQLPLCLSGEAIVRARPASGYQFLGWYEDEEKVSQDTLYTFYHNSPRELEARVRKATGQDEYQTINAAIYPNPTNGHVTIEASNLRYISIFNTLGQQVYNGSADGDVFEYDFGRHEAGIYLIRIETASGVVTKRVVVAKLE